MRRVCRRGGPLTGSSRAQATEKRPEPPKANSTLDGVATARARKFSDDVPGWRLRHYLLELCFRFVANDIGSRTVCSTSK